MKKRLLRLILSLTIVLSFFVGMTVTASAAATSPDHPVQIDYDGDGNSDASWDGASAITINSDATITITKAYEHSGTMTITGTGTNVTITGNGHEVSVPKETTSFSITSSANVSMTGVNLYREGNIDKDSAKNVGLISINAATVNASNIKIVDYELGGVFRIVEGGALTIGGNDTEITSYVSNNGKAIFYNIKGSVIVNGGKYTRYGNSGRIVSNDNSASSFTMTAGEITNVEGSTDAIINGNITITGGTISAPGSAAIRTGSSTDVLNISGCNIVNSKYGIQIGKSGASGSVTIGSGVTFSNNVVDIYIVNPDEGIEFDGFNGRASVDSETDAASVRISANGTAEALKNNIYPADGNLSVKYNGTDGYLYLTNTEPTPGIINTLDITATGVTKDQNGSLTSVTYELSDGPNSIDSSNYDWYYYPFTQTEEVNQDLIDDLNEAVINRWQSNKEVYKETRFTKIGDGNSIITIDADNIINNTNKAIWIFKISKNGDYVGFTHLALPDYVAYSISCASVTNGTLTVDKTSAAEGETVTINATPASGYVLDSITVIKDDSSTVVVDTTNNTFTMPDSDVVVSVTFVLNPDTKYSITCSSATNGTLTVDKETAKAGETVTITATPAEGYVLGSINAYESTTGRSVTINNNTFTMPANNVTVLASFVPAPVSTTENIAIAVDTSKLPAKLYPISSYYGIDEVYFDDIFSAFSVSNGYSIVKNKSYLCEKGNKNIPAYVSDLVEDTEYGILLYIEKNSGNFSENVTVPSGFELVPNTVQDPVNYIKVWYSLGKAQRDLVNDVKINTSNLPQLVVGETVDYANLVAAFSVDAEAPYSISSISLSGGNNSYSSGDTLSSNPDTEYVMNISLNFESKTSTINSVSIRNDFLYKFADSSNITFTPADKITLKSNYESSIWLYYDLGKAINPNAPTYDITLAGDGTATGGSFSVDKATAKEGETVTITATPDSGYVLDRITVTKDDSTPVAVTNNTFIMPDSDVVVSVTFKDPDSYKIILYNDGEPKGGTFSVDKSTAKAGETVKITVTPDQGYFVDSIDVFEATSGDNVAINDNTFIMPADNVVVQVIFKSTATYTITLYDENGMVSGGSYSVDKTTARAGDTVVITATPESGYYLDYVAYFYSYFVDDDFEFEYEDFDEFQDNTAITTIRFIMPAHNIDVYAEFKNTIMQYVDEVELIIDGEEALDFLLNGDYYSSSNSSDFPFSTKDKDNATEPFTYQFYVKAKEEHVTKGYLDEESYKKFNFGGWVYADCYNETYRINADDEYALGCLITTDSANYEFKVNTVVTCKDFTFESAWDSPEIVEAFVELGKVSDFAPDRVALTGILSLDADLIWDNIPSPDEYDDVVDSYSYLFSTKDRFEFDPADVIIEDNFAAWVVLEDGEWVDYVLKEEEVKDTDTVGLGLVLFAEKDYYFSRYIDIASKDGKIFNIEVSEFEDVPVVTFIISLGTKADVYEKLGIELNPSKASSNSPGSKMSYSVKLDTTADVENGNVTFSSKYAVPNEMVTITVTPDDGYELGKLVITDGRGNEIDFKDNGDGTYTFRMPAGNAKVNPVFQKIGAAKEVVLVLTIDQTAYQLDNANLVNDVAPIIRNDRTMLPIRLVAETLGATVTWNDAEKSVTIVKGDSVIVVYIGADYALVNGVPVQLDAPAFISNDRTYLPVRFISENLGATVNWDDVTRQVTISVA